MTRWAFRRKLNVLVAVPLAVVAVLLSYVLFGLVNAAREAAAAARLVHHSKEVTELIDRIQTEHQQALLLSVRYEAATSGRRPSLAAYREAQELVDAEVVDVRLAFGGALPPEEAQVLREINGLGSLRATIEQSYLPADNIDPTYDSLVDGLINGLGLDLKHELITTRTGNLLDSLLRAEAAHSSFETSVFGAQSGDSNALIEYNQAVGDQQLYTYQLERFGRYASRGQFVRLGGIERNPAWIGIQVRYARLQIDPTELEASSPATEQAALAQTLHMYPEYQKQAQTRLDIARSLLVQIGDRAQRASDRSWWHAAWLLSGAVLAFVLWLGFSVMVRRSVVRPVQALTGAAVQVADAAGEELARVADGDTGEAEDGADAGPPRLPEVSAPSRDEFGDLADAFNRVQATAAALLERQLLIRRNVAEMFGNVGRRVSNLTARQLVLIDAVERSETDPGLLDRLYRIDHLAVRLQRNADSLMLLAGLRDTGLESGPVPLPTVVRAALGRIEGYQRVEVASAAAAAEVTVAPDIIADLTLMLAELAENAVTFSPAHSPVEIGVRSGPEGAVVEVADHGLGMSAERLAEENARLVRRERLDLAPTKVLGLFVVGRIARRWGITVTLAATPGGGTTARVFVPAALLLRMSPFAAAAASPEGAAARDTGSRREAPVQAAAGRRDAGREGPRVAAEEVSVRRDGEHARGSDAGAAAGTGSARDRAAQAGGEDRPAVGTAPVRTLPDGEGVHEDVHEDVREERRGAQGAPPLQRRVRGATLRGRGEGRPVRSAAAADAGTGPGAGGATGGTSQPRGWGLAGPEDGGAARAAAEDVRAQLDEFEAAVARARQDSATAGPRGTNEEEQ